MRNSRNFKFLFSNGPIRQSPGRLLKRIGQADRNKGHEHTRTRNTEFISIVCYGGVCAHETENYMCADVLVISINISSIPILRHLFEEREKNYIQATVRAVSG